MTTGNDDNCKLPKDAVSKGDIELKYGFVNGEVRECGYTKIVYNNEEESEKTTEIRIHPTGDHEVTESNEKKKAIKLSAQSGEHRHYTAGGYSVHADGHYDHNSESTSRFESTGDMAHATGKNRMIGYKGQEVKIGGSKAGVSAGSAGTVSDNSSGSRRSVIDKDDQKHVKGNKITAVEGNKAEIVNKNVSLYVKQGFDYYIKEKGKVETGSDYGLISGAKIVQTSAADTKHSSDAKYSVISKEDMSHSSDAKLTINGKTSVTITSDTKITLKVGSNSIEISSSGIVINAGGGKVDIKASSDVITKGSSTKIQGGGQSAPPTTFN